MALPPFRALSEMPPSTPASSGPLGLGRPGLNLMTLRVKGQTGLLDGTVCPSLKYPLLALNRVPFTVASIEDEGDARKSNSDFGGRNRRIGMLPAKIVNVISMKIHLEGKIYGKVQGVFFRDATRAFADSRGIKGIVRNEPDGSVYLEAEGDKTQLNALRGWLWKGPSAADVEEVDLHEGELQNYEGFKVQI